MSASLTLLFLCDRTELHAPLIPALIAAGFELLIEHSAEDAKNQLSRVSANAIMIRHTAFHDGSLVGAELKLVAPQTPIILFPGNPLCRCPQIGIDSICHADPHDEILARAIAVFFHNALISKQPHRQARPREEKVQVRPADNETLMTL